MPFSDADTHRGRHVYLEWFPLLTAPHLFVNNFSVIFGIIIDTFGELRSVHAGKKSHMEVPACHEQLVSQLVQPAQPH